MDPRWRGGDYYDAAPGDGPAEGLSIARQAAAKQLDEIIAMALERAQEHASKAKAHLSVFPPSLERDALMALPDYVLARDR